MQLRFVRIKHSHFYLIMLWILFTSGIPFLFYMFPWHPHKWLIAAVLTFFVTLLIVKRRINFGDRNILVIISLQIFFFGIAAIYHSDIAYVNLIFQNLAVLITYIFISSFVNIRQLVHSFILFCVIMCIMGVLAFLGGVLGIIKPFSIYPRHDGTFMHNFILTFSNSVFYVNDKLVIRVAGFFDEPGTFAYFLTFALGFNKLMFNNKKYEKIIIFLGLFTFSLVFYITVVLYLFLFYVNYKNLTRFLTYIFVFFMTIYFVIIFQNKNDAINRIYTLTVSRLKLENANSNKTFAGDNRIVLFRKAMMAYKDAPLMGQGISYQEDSGNKFYKQHLGSNIMYPFAVYGLIGTIILFLHLIYLIYFAFIKSLIQLKLDKLVVYIIFLIFLNFIQRPYFLGLFTYMMFILLIETIRDRTVKKSNKALTY